MTTPLDAALDYIAKGWNPTPVRPRSKNPVLVNWESTVITAADAAQYFRAPDLNVGVVLGPSSHGLTDIDLDWQEARNVGPWFLPKTPGIFGRPSSRDSHWLYISDLCSDASIKSATLNFDDPSIKGQKGARIVELRIGGFAGAQTVFPPSIHKDTGEPISWTNGHDPDPLVVAGSDLLAAVRRTAASALLSRYWPQKQGTGGHNVSRLLGGLFRRAGFSFGDIALFIEATARAAGDSGVADRLRTARDAAEAFDAGKATQGLPTLEKTFGADLSNTLTAWLNLKRGAASRSSAAAATGPKPAIRLGPDLTAIAEQTENAMIDAGLPVMKRDQYLVRPAIMDAWGPFGTQTKTAALVPISQIMMRSYMDRSATFDRYDARTQDWIRTKPPTDIADLVLDRADEGLFPSVRGVLLTPALRPDGSVFADFGYDPQTKLFVLSPPNLPTLKTRPDKTDAGEALSFIDTLLTDFPWVSTPDNHASRTVALSGILSATCRAAMDTVPLHAATSPEPGSGKSYLADIACAIATGFSCPVMTVGKDETELQKRLDSTLLAGNPVVSLDNIGRPLRSDSLCNLLTSRIIEVRVLGQSKSPRLESRLTLFAAGNNLVIYGDLVRRSLLAWLDAAMETPWLRKFGMNPLRMVMADRGKYVAACLTIIRAYILAGLPNRPTPLESFEQWSDLIRGPLIWLGKGDPCDAIALLRQDDPEREELVQVIDAWKVVFTNPVTAAEVIEKATELNSMTGKPMRPDLHNALIAVAKEYRGSNLSVVRLGYWLRKHQNRIVQGSVFRRDGKTSKGVLWSLETV